MSARPNEYVRIESDADLSLVVAGVRHRQAGHHHTSGAAKSDTGPSKTPPYADKDDPDKDAAVQPWLHYGLW